MSNGSQTPGRKNNAVVQNIDRYLVAGIDNRATTIYLFPGSCITYRVGGKLLKVPDTDLTADIVHEIALSLFPESLLEDKTPQSAERFLKTTKAADFVHSIPGVARFRVHVFRQRGSLAICIRVISQQLPSISQYDLPAEFFELLQAGTGGLYIISGKARSGKSSLMAAILDYYNKNFSRVIVVLEPIIQFSHRNQFSLITQRELNIDMPTLKSGVEQALRQDQDVIILDELRDTETFNMVMEAVNRGTTVWVVTGTPDTDRTIQYLLGFKSRDAHLDIINDLMSYLRVNIITFIKTSDDGQRTVKTDYKSAGLLNTILLSRRREFQEKGSEMSLDEDLGSRSSVDQSWFEAD